MSRQLNLMPAGALRRQILTEAIRLWLRVLLAVAAIAVAFGGAEMWRCRESLQARDALEAEHAPIKQLKTEIRTLRAKIAGLQKSEQLAIDLAVEQPLATLLGRIGRSAAYAGGELFVEHLNFKRRQPLMTGPSVPVLELRGVAKDNMAITRFVDQVRETGMFGDVRLRSTASRMLASQPVTAFDLECSL